MGLEIEDISKGIPFSEVDVHWSGTAVSFDEYKTVEDSIEKLHIRNDYHPLILEITGFYGDHIEETILDYGCGVGHDLVGFLIYSKAKKIFGIDVSPLSLNLAASRLMLHESGRERIKLFLSCDLNRKLPFEDESIDFISCIGVLHHVSLPHRILEEFYRVLKPKKEVVLMVYNYDSLFLHLYIAYQLRIVEGKFKELTARGAFEATADLWNTGKTCPIAKIYKSEEFLPICEAAGFRARHAGNYYSNWELERYQIYGVLASKDLRLETEHWEFLSELKLDPIFNLPVYREERAGIGGIYKLRKE